MLIDYYFLLIPIPVRWRTSTLILLIQCPQLQSIYLISPLLHFLSVTRPIYLRLSMIINSSFCSTPPPIALLPLYLPMLTKFFFNLSPSILKYILLPTPSLFFPSHYIPQPYITLLHTYCYTLALIIQRLKI